MPGTPQGDFDERLHEALKSALSDGEEIVAQEAGDQGQAIALTKDHIILVRVGLAATGEMNGHKTTKFALGEVTSVNLRKGALGAVIQICSSQAHSGTPNGAPENVIVFTGPGRVKKAETFADTIEHVAQKSVSRFEPLPQVAPEADEQTIPEAPKPGRKRQTLAEEIYNESMQAKARPDESAAEAEAPQEVESVPAEQTQATADVEFDLEEPDTPSRSAYNPNPRLPKPVRKKAHGPNKMLVVLGVLAGLTVVGMAVMAPIHDAKLAPAPIVGTSAAAISDRSIRLQMSAVSNYQDEVAKVMAGADAEASALRSAVRSGSQPAVQSACKPGRIDTAWEKIGALSAPPGLAEASQNLLNGLLMMKNAASAAAASETVDSKEALARFDEAEALIRKGRTAIAEQRATLAKQAAEAAKTLKRKP